MTRLLSRLCSSFVKRRGSWGIRPGFSRVSAESSRVSPGERSGSTGPGLAQGVSPQISLMTAHDGARRACSRRGRHPVPWSRRAPGTLWSVPARKGRPRCRNHCSAKQAPLDPNRLLVPAATVRNSTNWTAANLSALRPVTPSQSGLTTLRGPTSRRIGRGRRLGNQGETPPSRFAGRTGPTRHRCRRPCRRRRNRSPGRGSEHGGRRDRCSRGPRPRRRSRRRWTGGYRGRDAGHPGCGRFQAQDRRHPPGLAAGGQAKAATREGGAGRQPPGPGGTADSNGAARSAAGTAPQADDDDGPRTGSKARALPAPSRAGQRSRRRRRPARARPGRSRPRPGAGGSATQGRPGGQSLAAAHR